MSAFTKRALRGAGATLFFFLSIATPSQAETKLKAKAEEIPVAAFANLPTFSNAKLSRTGKNLGYFVSRNGRNHIVFADVGRTKGSTLPPPENAEIINFYWVNDEVMVIQFGFTVNRQVFIGQSYETRAYTLNTKTLEYKWLGRPKRAARMTGSERVSQFERIIDLLPDDPDHILIQLDFELDGNPSVYKVNVNNGRRQLEKRGREGIQNWYTDQTSEVRLGFGYSGRDRKAVMKHPTDGWVDLTDTEWENRLDIEGFSADPNILYVSGLTEHGTNGLFKLNLLSGKVTEQVFAHETVDIDSIVEHPVTGKLAGVAFTVDYEDIEYFDQTLKIVQASLEHVMPGKNVDIAGHAYTRELYLVRVSDGKSPGDYYIYDRDTKRMDHVAARNEPISNIEYYFPELMVAAKPVSIPVRDGTGIPGYLTLPAERGDQPLPTVILPHGGPHARDTAEWDYWTQFYASRGYAVLQPNFRGSTGYGPVFRLAGKKQWGGLMQQDVTDATRWAIQQGIADPGRICIVGASYGGYAALMGTIQEPGLYRCAISVNGVTDLPRLKRNDRHYIGGRVWIQDMGLEGVDDDEVSPHDLADRISAPVLLMSSKDDERIPYKHSQALHRRLKKLKKDSAYVEIEDGGHSMITSAARMTMLTESEKFLKKHLGR